MSDRTAKIINVHYLKLHMHVKISRVNIKRMEIVHVTSKPVEKGKMERERKRTKLTQERNRKKNKNYLNEQKIKIVIMIRAERNTDYAFKIVHKDISQYNMQALVTNKIIYKSQHLHALIGHTA